MSAYWLLLIITISSAKAFLHNDLPSLQTFVLSGSAQGTSYEIKYRASKSVLTEPELKALFTRVDQSLSLYNPKSLISVFNKSDKEIICDQYLLPVIQKSLEVCVQSDGAFDITVKPLVDLWGFGSNGEKNIPSNADIQNVLSSIGCQKIYLIGSRLIKENKLVQIDCNGIAQGYTVDLIAVLIESKGISNYMVELGGEIRLLGMNEKELPWSVGIESSEINAMGSHPVKVVLRPGNGAITTSGSYRNYFSKVGKKYSHIINPSTGYSISNGMVSATILAPDAITADALDNVCMVLGPEASIKFLQRYANVEAYLVFEKPDGQLADTATRGFNRFLVQ
jgi:thiamine biosynthesis lipoprotein